MSAHLVIQSCGRPLSAFDGRRIKISKNDPRVIARIGVIFPLPTGKGPKTLWKHPRLAEALLPVNRPPHCDVIDEWSLVS